MKRGTELTFKQVNELVGKFVIFWWEDKFSESGEGSMAGWIWKVESDGNEFWIVTDDGMGIRLKHVIRWEEDLSDTLPRMWPYILIDKNSYTLRRPMDLRKCY